LDISNNKTYNQDKREIEGSFGIELYVFCGDIKQMFGFSKQGADQASFGGGQQ